MDIGTYTDRLTAIKGDLSNIIIKTLETMSADFVNKQIDQIRHGFKSDGALIGKYRSPQYAAFKANVMNSKAPNGYIDLTLTKQFTENIFAKFESDGFILDSKDTKRFLLQSYSWWDENIFGMMDESLTDLADKITEAMTNAINERLAA